MADKLKLCKLGCGTALAFDTIELPPVHPWQVTKRKRQQARLCKECRMAFQCCAGRGMCCKCRAVNP